MGKMEPGVNVYCKKVLIQAKHRDILPDWLRFVKGAVDSEDLPLHISREHLQNSPLIRRINSILTRKILRVLEEEMKKDMTKYMKFYDEFGKFLKEGISSDQMYKDELARLLIFETSKTKENERITFNEYTSRMQKGQNKIYYIVAPSRKFAEESPYFEAFKNRDIEVIFLYQSVDEFVMGAIQNFKGYEIQSCEQSDIKADDSQKQPGLSNEQIKELEKWYTEIMKGKVESVTVCFQL